MPIFLKGSEQQTDTGAVVTAYGEYFKDSYSSIWSHR